MNQFIMKTKSKIKKNKNKKSRYKLKTVLFKCGYFRRSEKFIKEFNELLNENGMIVEPKLTTNIPNSINDWIYFKFDEPLENIKPSKKGGNIKMAYNFKPYDHQKEAWNHMDKHYIDDNKNRGMVVLPTGERVIIVMGAVCVIKSRVLGTLTKYISCIA